MRRFVRLSLLPGVWLAALTLLAFGEIRNYFFTDVDTFSLINDGRFQTFAGALGHFDAELMAGRMVNAVFYRPLTSVTLGAEYAVFGLNPRGYHLLDLTIVAATAFLLLKIAQRIWGPKRGTGIGSLAAVLFLLHPLQLDAIAAIARLGDLLFTFFCLLALHCMLDVVLARRIGLRRTVMTALSVVFTCFAFLAKEPGIVTPVIVGVGVFVFNEESQLLKRVRRALLLISPHLAATSAVFLWRLYVLHGLGGYVDHHGRFYTLLSGLSVKLTFVGHIYGLFLSGVTDSLDRYGALFLVEHRIIIYPFFVISLALLLAAVIRSYVLRVAFVPYRDQEDTSLTDDRACWIFGGLIGVYGCLLLVTGFSVRYLYFTLTGFAVLLAVALFRTCASVAKRQNGYARLVALAVIIAVLYWNSPAWNKTQLRRWKMSGEVARTILGDLDRIVKTGEKRHIYVLNLPYKINFGQSTYASEVPDNQLLLDHSLVDYLSLRGLDETANLPEVVVLNYLLITGPPVELKMHSEFVSANRLQVVVDHGGVPTRYPWSEIKGRRTGTQLFRVSDDAALMEKEPARDRPRVMTILVLPEALAQTDQGFYAYDGNGLHEVRAQAGP